MKKDAFIKLFFGWLILFGLLILLIWFSPLPEGATGSSHPVYSSMFKSGPSVALQAHSKYMAYFFGLGITCIFGLALFLGAWKNGQRLDPGLGRWLLAGMLLYMLAFTLTVGLYWQDLARETTPYVLGFPLPTAFMLFGIGSVPIIFTLIYILGFDKWILTPEEQKRFEELIRAKRENEGGLS
ncbi:MAG: hypothetical protein D6730_01980 [Bacteroidetes bacterium]|nr:MAG: hypothetical protein D6730_01980 [Bacteroidota bacterium]